MCLANFHGAEKDGIGHLEMDSASGANSDLSALFASCRWLSDPGDTFLCKNVKVNICVVGRLLPGDEASLGSPWSIKVSQCWCTR